MNGCSKTSLSRRWQRPPLALAVLLGSAVTAACGPTFGSSEGEPAGAAGTGGMAGRGAPGAGSGGATGSINAGRGGAGGSAQPSAGSTQGGTSSLAGRPGAGNAGEAGAGEEPRGGSSATAGTGASSGEGTGGPAGSAGSYAAGGFGGVAGVAGLGGAGATASGGVAGSSGTTAGSPSGGTEAGSAGSAGNASGGTGAGPGPCMPALVIDDMEDGDDHNCPNQGRSGDWWTATGQTGTIDPPTQGNFPAHPLGADARARSNYGMRLAGTGFGYTEDDWASLGFYLAGGATYDLTAYQGLAFYGKSKTGALTLHVKVATSLTTPESEGGACTEDCNDHYKGVVTLDGTWREFSIGFSSLAQEGWGEKTKELERTLFVYFGYLGTDLGPTSFEFLIDDVRLY